MKNNRLSYLIEEIGSSFEDDITYYETLLDAWNKLASDCGGHNTSLYFKISQRITGVTV